MPSTRTRIFAGAFAMAATGAMLLSPAVSHADGTKDQRYSAPPQDRNDPNDERGDVPLNEQRAPVQNCPGGARGGFYRSNPSYYPIELGLARSFNFWFDTKGIPDKFDILYEGRQIETTGWRGTESANSQGHNLSGGNVGSKQITLPAGVSTKIEVRVNTDDVDTEWEFKVTC